VAWQLRAERGGTGFKTFIATKIQLLATETRRLDPQLQVGDAATKIEVVADVAQLQVDNGAKQEAVAPTVINQLPLLVSAGTPAHAVQFIAFLPGVNTGTSPQALKYCRILLPNAGNGFRSRSQECHRRQDCLWAMRYQRYSPCLMRSLCLPSSRSSTILTILSAVMWQPV